jgi:hypothetical protein
MLRIKGGKMYIIKMNKIFYFLLSIIIFTNCDGKKEVDSTKISNVTIRSENQDTIVKNITDSLPVKNEDFGIVKRNLHPNPSLLLSEYLKRDSKGEFLKQNEWFDTALLKPFIVPGWDAATLIEKYDVDTIEIDSNFASFNVTYYKIADILQNKNGQYLSFSKKTELKKYNLQLTKYGWRISPPYVNPHVSYKYITSILPVNYKDSLNIFLSK